MTPKAGEYLFSGAGFSNGAPFLEIQDNGHHVRFDPLGLTLTLRFKTTNRYCIGWHNLDTGENHACPEAIATEGKYEQCSPCQKRTGFNPAFYHATSVSPQQEARNQEPHILYLAYFPPSIIKVGISYAKRGLSRLHEQGARSAVILGTFPTAHIARQYEAEIAKLTGIAETVHSQKKLASLKAPHSYTSAATALLDMKTTIESALGVAFDQTQPLDFEEIYFPSRLTQPLADSHNNEDAALLSGVVRGMLGTLLFCEHQDTNVFLPLKKHVGHKVLLDFTETDLGLPSRQMSLF